MIEQPETITNEGSSSQEVVYPTVESRATIGGPVGNVQIVQIDDQHLEIRYCDVPKKSSLGWLIPIDCAKDLVRWWVEQGRAQAPWGGLAPQQCVGRAWVSILSEMLVYVRGSNAFGKPLTTGFLFPRLVVEALAVSVVLRDQKDQTGDNPCKS